MFSLLAWSVISEVAMSVVEMFLLRMTAARDFASTEKLLLGCTTAAMIMAYLSVSVYLA